MDHHFNVRNGLDNIDWEQLFQLYGAVGLVAGHGKKGDTDVIREVFIKSYKVAIAYGDDKIIGAGRMLSDGLCFGTIFDVGVLPDYRKKGVGKAIMLSLMKGEERLCFHLTATFGNEGFYKKLGFRKHKTAFAKYPFESEYLE